MPRTHPIYIAILLSALLMAGSAFYTIFRVELKSSEGPVEPFSVDPPKALPKPHRESPGLQKIRAYLQEKRALQKRLPWKSSEEAMIREYRGARSPRTKRFLLMRARAHKGAKRYPNFYYEVYKSSEEKGLKREALLGLARTESDRVVSIIEKDIYGIKPPREPVWQFYGLDILLQARTDGAKGLLLKIARTHPDSRVASKAREYLAFLQRISKK